MKEQEKLKIEILYNQFLKENGKFDKHNAALFAGKIAGICYSKNGYEKLKNESVESTIKRVDLTLKNGHHSVYDHVNVNLNIKNIPKILAMVINNEKQYTTSEKSLRYTKVSNDSNIISDKEIKLYNKWIDIFKIKINSLYNLDSKKVEKLAMENARYLVTVFMPTEMIYTTSLRQINYIASWMTKYIEENQNSNDYFNQRLCKYMKDFVDELESIDLLIPELMTNEKNRKLSLFNDSIINKTEIFDEIYSTNYKCSFVSLAQAQRHRTISYQMQLLDKKEYFIPPIIQNDNYITNEWLDDINSLKGINPQGELVLVNEKGTYDDFILKCKERLCTNAQLEVMLNTKDILEKYKQALELNDNYLKNDIINYTHGARCTFKDYKCPNDCKFKHGKTLERKI